MGEKRIQLEHIYRESLMTLIIHVLKTFSSKDSPISIPEISNGIYTITGQIYSINTIKRYFYDLLDIMTANTDYGNMNQMLNAFIYAYGGYVREIHNTSNKNNSGNRYYFDPLFSVGDINMLSSTITASRFFNNEEKEYFYSRLRTLKPYSFNDELYNNCDSTLKDNINTNAHIILSEQHDQINNVNSTTVKPPKQKKLLHIIQSLDISIRKRQQITIRYGSYNYDDSRLDHLRLMDRNKEYVLNPYALCWNNGSYYLICTNIGSDTPYHFRVDRILNVTITGDVADAIPSSLSSFFKNNRFDVNEYTRTHPYMAIYDTSDRVNCTFEIYADSLSILVDYFGRNIRLTKTDIEKTDKNGKSFPLLKAEIFDVEYSCLRTFAIQHHNTMKVISPTRLIHDLRNELINSLHMYE